MRLRAIVLGVVFLGLGVWGPGVEGQERRSPRRDAIEAGIADFWSAHDVELTAEAREAVESAFVRGLPEDISAVGAGIITKVYLEQVLTRLLGDRTGGHLSESDLAALPPASYLEDTVGKGRVGYLRLTSTPLGGAVSVDGELRGQTPDELVLPTGVHDVVVRFRSGTCEERLRIKKDELSSIHCSPS
ncbi:MAG: PEGA domain-containing protein [Thermoanaerobaculia bacterium]